MIRRRSRKGDKQGESERKEEGVKSPECGDNGWDVGQGNPQKRLGLCKGWKESLSVDVSAN